MTTAFVLSGGGSLGAVQVGMLAALAARGIEPDLLVGTSAGAVNAVWVAGHGTGRESLAGLARLWVGLRRTDVFPVSPGRAVVALAGRRTSLVPDTGLRRLLREHAGLERLEEAVIPVHVVATDLLCGEEVVISSGDAATAVLASAAIPGVLPPVEHDGRVLVDGAIAGPAALGRAVELGATEVYVLPAGYPCALSTAPRSALGVTVQALTLLVEEWLVVDVARWSRRVPVHVVPPLCPLDVAGTDFSHARALIERSRRASTAWLADGGTRLPHQESFLSMHRHG